MFIVTNQAEVKKRVQANRVLFWVGVGCLVASMTSLFLGGGGDPTLVFVFGYPFLILGVILTKRGAFNNRRHGVGGYKVPPEETLIDDALKGVPPRYHLYNWVKLDDILVEHMLVTPHGVLLISMKAHLGTLKAGRDLYRLKRGALTWLGTFGEPGLANPSRDLSAEVKKVRKWFEKAGYNLPVDGIICFYNPRTEIQAVEDMSFPVCTIKDLKAAVRIWETELNMSSDQQQEVEKLLVKQLPEEQVAEVTQLLEMPAAKRQALQLAAEREREKEVAEAKAAKKPVKERLEEKAKERKKVQQAANPGLPGTQRVGLNGKPLETKEVRRAKIRRSVEPLQKPNPGAFGEPSNRKK